MPMFLHPPPPPVERKPTLPLVLCTILNGVPGLLSFEDVTQALLAMAETADKARLVTYMDTAAYAQPRGSAGDLLLTAIDAATGDSVVHRAAAAGNMTVLSATWPALAGP